PVMAPVVMHTLSLHDALPISGKSRKADGTLDAGPLGYVHGPEDLLVDADGNPRRIDHAFSWSYPLAAHGMMHTVLRNAHAGDPRSEEHTSELQSRENLVCRLL